MKRTLLMAAVVSALISHPSWSQTDDGEFLSSQKLQEAYRRYCPANTEEFRSLLAANKTMALGTGQLVTEVYGSLLKCEYSSDILYIGIQDEATVRIAEALIRQLGKEKYAAQSIAGLAEAKRKFKIDHFVRIVKSGAALSENDVKLIAAFARKKALNEALISVLNSSAGQ